ncbi:acyltransferase family protein [Chryseobacterium luquanense]|uniref:Acyltransferase family protein n=1 Tax=Chryseobacterium luquanense TaxID=2983766 RepID=A0ABT3XZS0_9FLAO|nr:acyltransferase family protein [Chryseobacterium luquanense]MCX8531385.1 acyltransferase family protein [Chryseobacterium luquanense]
MGRNLSIDILKIILALFVVFLHMNFLKETYPMMSFLLVNGIFRIAVPVFLVITGFYFFHIDTTKKLQKLLFRTFLLYAIWMLIYISYWKDNEQVWLTVIFGYHHLWYLIGTLFSGIILFLLRNQKVILLSVLVFIFFGIGYIIQVLGNLHHLNSESDSLLNDYLLYRNFLFVCFPFLTIGFLINKLKINFEKYKYSYVLVVFSVVMVIAESYFNYKMISSESTDILFSLLFVSPILFLYGQKIYIKTQSKIWASLSTAIYVVHPLIMKSDFYKEISSEYKILLFFLILIPVSLLLVFLNQKLKYLL